jgi:hypothetical protein
VSPDPIEGVRAPRLGHEPILEGLGVAGAVTHSSRGVPETKASKIKQGRVGIANGVPTHSPAMEVAHGGDESLSRLAVVTADGKFELTQDLTSARTKRHHAMPCASLWLVEAPLAVSRAAHMAVCALDVSGPQGHDLAPSQAGQQYDLRNLAPHARHVGDHVLDLRQRQIVGPRLNGRDARTVNRQRQMADNPSACGMPQDRSKAGVDPPNGGWRVSLSEQVVDEAGEIIGPQMANRDVAEGLPDVPHPPSVASEGVWAGRGVAFPASEPKVQCSPEGFVRPSSRSRKRPLRPWEVVSRWDVGLAATGAGAYEPLASAGLPLRSWVPTLLDERGHGRSLRGGDVGETRS